MNISGIEIQVYRKRIKNLHLYVKPPDGHVEISAPVDVSDQTLAVFARTRMHWIRRQMEKFEQQPRQTARQYVSGETFYLWGKKYYLSVKNSSHSYSLVLVGDRAFLTVRKGSTLQQRENFVRGWYREILNLEIEKRLPELEKSCGLQCRSWQVKYMTTRWGTCNTATQKIWLNLQLAKKPVECLDYIILHELIHLQIRDHSERFVMMMDQIKPQWREIKNQLNEQILDFMTKSDCMQSSNTDVYYE